MPHRRRFRRFQGAIPDREGKTLVIEPCIPRAWKGFELSFKYRSARYEIVVENPHGVSSGIGRMELDGERLATGAARFNLNDDGVVHRIR